MIDFVGGFILGIFTSIGVGIMASGILDRSYGRQYCKKCGINMRMESEERKRKNSFKKANKK